MIVLATPTRDLVTALFAGDLLKLCRRHPEMRFAAPLGIYIANLRQSAVSIAQQTGASHLLFIDADMRFPEDTLDRLLAADKDIVAANCVMRTMPEWWVARKAGQVVSSVGRSGLEQVDSVGCGVMLIRLAVFDDLPRPWFSTPWNGQDHDGEDLYFCRLARAHGFAVWIDHDLSQAVRHTGSVELGVPMVPEVICNR
jgi:hypothetical protein